MFDFCKTLAFVAVAAYCLNHLGLVNVKNFGQQFILSKPASEIVKTPPQNQSSELQITGIDK